MRRLALNSNLLVLLCIGKTRPDLIETHKRTRQYRTDDFRALVRQMRGAERLVAMP
jgi:hypothetical protein